MITDNRFDVFISYSYSDQDRGFLDKLEAHLGALRRQSYISIYADHKISAGTKLEHEIDSHLKTAHIILLLVSPNFLNSEYSYHVEMKQAMEQQERGTARVIPILLRACDWEKTPLAQLDILPRNHIPVVEFQDPDEAFCDIAIEIRHIVENLLINKWRVQGNELYRRGEYREALAVYEQILRLKNSLATSIDLGTVLNDLQRYEEALSTYDKCVEGLNFDKSSLKTMALVENSPDYTGKLYQEALKIYEQVFQRSLSFSSDWPGMILEDVPILSASEQLIVIDRLNQAVEHNPINPFLYHLKGNVYFRLEQYREALDAYDQAIELQESFKLPYKYLAEAIERIGRQEYQKLDRLARRDLEKANQIRDKRDNSGPERWR